MLGQTKHSMDGEAEIKFVLKSNQFDYEDLCSYIVYLNWKLGGQGYVCPNQPYPILPTRLHLLKVA